MKLHYLVKLIRR